MKRSKFLVLVAMGLAAGCTDAPDNVPETKTEQSAAIFKNSEECVKSGISREECEKAYQEALANAPKFASQEECIARFGEGACIKKEGGNGSFFMPMLMGFMAGRLMGGAMQPAQAFYGNETPGNDAKRPPRLQNAPPASQATPPASSPKVTSPAPNVASPAQTPKSRNGFSGVNSSRFGGKAPAASSAPVMRGGFSGGSASS